MPNLTMLAGDGDRFAVVDTETTGLGADARIVEIAVITVSLKGEIRHVLETLINPEGDVGPTHIHQINNRMVRRAPTFPQVALGLAELLNGACIVGHHVQFDIRMMRQEFERIGIVFDVTSPIDTKRFSEGKLEQAFDKYGIPPDLAHSALADASVCASLLIRYGDETSGPQTSIRGVERIHNKHTHGFRPVLRKRGSKHILEDISDCIHLSNLPCSPTPTRSPKPRKVTRSVPENIVFTTPQALDINGVREVVVSGAHPELTRTEIHAELTSWGYKPNRSVTNRTDLVLVGTLTNPSKKLREAEKAGIQMFPLTEYRKLEPEH